MAVSVCVCVYVCVCVCVWSEFSYKRLTLEIPLLVIIFVSRDELCSNAAASGLS